MLPHADTAADSTIAPDAVYVALRDAGGTVGPFTRIAADLHWKVAAYIATAQAFARQQLVAVKPPAEGRPGDGDPAIAIEAAQGEDVR